MSTSIQQQIIDTANSYGVDPNLALAVAQKESGFNQAAMGSSGEIGVFQLMPATAQSLGVNPYDLSGNIDGGIGLLSTLLSKYNGNTSLALAAYNAGEPKVDAGNIPTSTQTYVQDILGSIGSTDTVSASSSGSDSWILWALGGVVALVWAMGE